MTNASMTKNQAVDSKKRLLWSAILGADGSSQESEKLTDVEQRGEEGSWEMGLQGKKGDAEGYIEIAREGMQFGKRGFGCLIKEVEK
ncbi:hypothetical protein OIU85_025127 [Salix viminalis]|uniref:Uncharacterized protein n=1 Tax=Salix viminalis TaxID=40686 RepID=A0A9Q0U267_SALVM|nr:hypothetical protein OIU85_025127 [Salix viminalis]